VQKRIKKKLTPKKVTPLTPKSSGTSTDQGSTAKHHALTKEIMLEMQCSIPKILIFRRDVGLYYTKVHTPIRIGQNGQCDIWFVLDGRHGEIEVKTGNSRLSKPQKFWKNVCLDKNIFWFEARNAKDAVLAVRLWANKMGLTMGIEMN
jgi:hypothetical protein